MGRVNEATRHAGDSVKANTSFPKRLLRWYARHARTLPWRVRHDPYRVWISEIMLQQTRVESVIPYFERWMQHFPTLEALAGASEMEVLSAWEGLGYYARARNARRAARLMVRDLGGRVPKDVEALRSLPGIGQYTAAAIASIAFGVDAPALDGNIRRVLARLFNVASPADSAAGRSKLRDLASIHLAKRRAGDYNQALMDLGATICLPRQPRCPICPLRRECKALRFGTVDRRPVLRSKRRPPLYYLGAAVVRRRGRVLLAQRASEGLLGGLWEFPNARLDPIGKSAGSPRRSLVHELRRIYGVRLRANGTLAIVRHAYTHFRVSVEVHDCILASAQPGPRLRWIRISDLYRYPMGKVDRQIALRLTV